jgi:hypothetical protein
MLNSITADAATQATLNQLDQLTEIRDTQGRVLGFFAPADRLNQLLYLEAAQHFDPQEIERRKASGGKKYTTQEVLDYLHSLETP